MHILKRMFSGRLSQKGYWLGFLSIFVLLCLSGVLVVIADLALNTLLIPGDTGEVTPQSKAILSMITLIWKILVLITLFPMNLGIQIRRGHDANLTGWIAAVLIFSGLVVVNLVAVVPAWYPWLPGAIDLLVLLYIVRVGFKSDTKETNRFGEYVPYTTLNKALFGE